MMNESPHLPRILRFQNLSRFKDITHFVSTRTGGVSPPPFESLNLGFHTADDPTNVLQNRIRLASSLGIPLEHFTMGTQVHECKVQTVTSDLRGRGSSDHESGLEGTDGMVTGDTDVCLTVLVADCVPILFFNPVQKVVGVAHAGWRGTVKLIAQKVVRTMEEHFGSRPADILVGVGPSIGPCCYQVGREVISQIEETLGTTRHELITRETPDGRGYLDLWEANRRQLLDTGILEENIENAGMCTRCLALDTSGNASLFFSERRCSGTGRFGAGIMLANEPCADCTIIECTWCNK